MEARFPFLALLHKELLNSLRLKRIWFLMLLAVAVVFCFAAYVFYEAQNMRMYYSFYSPMSGMSETMMYLLAFGNLGILCILVPALSAIAVCVEKQQGNFDLLITTLIKPSGIFFGKMLNILGVYALFAVATLPAFGALYYFVGIEWIQLLQIMLVLSVSAVHLCAIGLYCSIRLYRTVPAMVASYLVGSLVTGLPQVLLLMLMDLFLGIRTVNEEWVGQLMGIISSFLALGFIISPIKAISFQPLYFLAYHSFWIAFFTFLSLRRLARPMPDILVESRKPIDKQAELDVRRKKFPYYLSDPMRRRELLPDGRNPIVYKEMYSGFLGTLTRRIRVAYLVCIVAFIGSIFFMMDFYASDWPDIVVNMLLFQTCIVLLLVPMMSATVLVKEYELENMDMLRMTLLTRREILFGKIRAAFTGMYPILIALALANVPLFVYSMMYASFHLASAWISGVITLLLSVAFAVLASVIASLFCRKSVTAIISAYLLGAFALGGMALLLIFALLFLDEFMDIYDLNDLEEFGPHYAILFFSPLALQFMNMMDWGNAYVFDNNPSYFHFYYINLKWLMGTVYNLAILFGLLLLSLWLFHRKLRKDSQ